MTFVHVENGRLITQTLQCAKSTNAKEHLLRDAQFRIANVQAVCELAILGIIFRDVGVHQDELVAADIELVKPGKKAAPGQIDRDGDRFVLFVIEGDQRQVVEVQLDVAGFLPAVLTDPLREVAEGIEETDCHQGQTEVAGFLEVVAREHAQTAGIDHQGLVQTVFKREVSDLLIRQGGVGFVEPGVILVHVGIKLAHDPVVAFEEIAVLDQVIKHLAVNLPEEDDRVVGALLPRELVNFLEHARGFGVADPPKVVGKVSQPLDAVGQIKTIRGFSNDLIHILYRQSFQCQG